MYSPTDISSLEQMITIALGIATLAGLLLAIFGVIYGIRTWMAQTAVFKIRKDIAEIKQMLNSAKAHNQSQAPDSVNSDITDGPKLADN